MTKATHIPIRTLERRIRADIRNKPKMRALNAVLILEEYEEMLRRLREGRN